MFLSRKHSLSSMYDETVALESPHGLKVSVKVESPRYRTGDPVEDGSPSLALYRGCRAGHRLCGFILKRYVCSRLDSGQPRLNNVHEGEFSICDDVICDGGVDVASECQSILQQAEVMQVPTLAIAMSEADTEAGDIAAVLKTVSTFHPEHLSEVVLTASNEQEKSSVESQCQELFHLELKTTHRQEDSIPSLKEEFEPLLRVPPDSGGVTDVGPTLSENIASRVRKMAQVVIDSLISVKTQDEDDQPYRKTE
ncbi:uncharacterized protein LOC124121685 isoform X1 [Haliotis rufescens]|uniref:uncharacterized protein LOC124121685 isoform X1 n=1 Tax=Haliotis rufescens TaxID=6454 RepID=UPI001EB097A7|nr:uncharacterized protein LOC124121685 isoform X1 [Haliotis rufescens]